MKKSIKKFTVLSFLISLCFITNFSFADAPPDPGGGPGGGAGPVGGGAPLGSGLVLLIGLGSAYGSMKVFSARKKLME